MESNRRSMVRYMFETSLTITIQKDSLQNAKSGAKKYYTIANNVLHICN